MRPASEGAGTVAQDYEALLQFLYMAPIGLAQTSLSGEIALINPLCAQLLMPLSRDGGLANLFSVLAPIAPDLAHRASTFAPLHGRICDAMHLQLSARAPGDKEPQMLSLTLLKLDGERLMAVIDDVTQSVKRDRELRHSQAWIHSISTGIADFTYALMSLDSQGVVQGWNAGIRNLTGFEAEATIGHSYATFYPEGNMTSSRALERVQEADRTGWNLEEGWLRRINGDRYWGSCLIAPVCADDAVNRDDRTYSLVIRDISDRREADEALRLAVWSDHLTGLANRRAFFEVAASALQRRERTGMPISLALFDADHFKVVNDSHGHAAGDAVLRHLAAGLLSTFQATDIVARFGGEEFIVLMPGRTLHEAQAMAERFRAHLAAGQVTVNGASVRCTVSAGVVHLVDGIDGIDELVRCADDALYAAKAAGRNRVVCWDGTHPPAPRTQRLKAAP